MVTRALVTGGAGFIGSHVVDGLLADGVDVTVLDSLHHAAHAARPSYLRTDDVRYVFEDVRDGTSVERALRDCDGVFHLAGKVGLGIDLADLPEYVTHNVSGMASLLEAMRVTGFEGPTVLASSMVVYGEGRYVCPVHGAVAPAPRQVASLDNGDFEPPCPSCDAPLTPEAVSEDAALDPRNVYAATKEHQERLLRAWCRETDLPGAALRYHNVYGSRMPQNTPYAGVASIFRSALERGEAPRVFEDGGQLRDFIDVSDVARATIGALGTDGPFNVGTGEPHTVGDMATALAAALDGPEPVVTGAYRLGDVRHIFADVERLRGTGWAPAMAFADGMRAFASATLREAVG